MKKLKKIKCKKMDPKIQKTLKEIDDLDLYQQDLEKKFGLNVIPEEERVISIGSETGLFLNSLARAISAKVIVEVGSSYGYSTIWLADAIKNRGTVFSSEINLKKIEYTQKNLEKAGLKHCVTLLFGNALETLQDPRIKNVDLALIDANKAQYSQYFDILYSKIKPGGIIIADNMSYPKHFKQYADKYKEHIKKFQVQTQTINIGWGLEFTIVKP